MHDTPFLDRESHEDWDKRTWREHCTVNRDGQVCIPAMAFKLNLDSAAFKLGMKVPNRRGAMFKGFFVSGIICDHDVPIANGSAHTKESAECRLISAHANGRRGSGSRVPRRFPEFPVWHGIAEFTILDDIITAEVFEQHVKAGGIIVGVGRFRPENGGTNGRFSIKQLQWADARLPTKKAA